MSNRKKTWKKQGSYVSQKGVKMILEMDENGATVLSPVTKIKPKQ
jgi:uncharacterized protein YceK